MLHQKLGKLVEDPVGRLGQKLLRSVPFGILEDRHRFYAPVGCAAGLGLLVDLVVHVQAFEHELGRARGRRRTQLAVACPRYPARSKLLGPLPQPGNLADSLEHRGYGKPVAHLNALPVLEVVDDRSQLAQIKMSRRRYS